MCIDGKAAPPPSAHCTRSLILCQRAERGEHVRSQLAAPCPRIGRLRSSSQYSETKCPSQGIPVSPQLRVAHWGSGRVAAGYLVGPCRSTASTGHRRECPDDAVGTDRGRSNAIEHASDFRTPLHSPLHRTGVRTANYRRSGVICCLFWCRWKESNPRPSHYEAERMPFVTGL